VRRRRPRQRVVATVPSSRARPRRHRIVTVISILCVVLKISFPQSLAFVESDCQCITATPAQTVRFVSRICHGGLKEPAGPHGPRPRPCRQARAREPRPYRDAREAQDAPLF